MKSVGLINKFNSICKWKDKTINILKDIDKLLSWINSFLSWNNLNKAQLTLNQDELQRIDEIVHEIERLTSLIMNFDKFIVSSSKFKFSLFTKEIKELQQQLESFMNLLKSSKLAPSISYLFTSIENIWESEYGDIDKRDEDCEGRHPIFGKEIWINDSDVKVNNSELISILQNNWTSLNTWKVSYQRSLSFYNYCALFLMHRSYL